MLKKMILYICIRDSEVKTSIPADLFIYPFLLCLLRANMALWIVYLNGVYVSHEELLRYTMRGKRHLFETSLPRGKEREIWDE